MSANETRDEDNDHRSYGCGDNPVRCLIADTQINPQALQKEAPDQRACKAGDDKLEKT
jgi:hypothetical protein